MALRAVCGRAGPKPGVAIWAPDHSGTIELARLDGPSGGRVLAPLHLVDDPATTDPVWDIDDRSTKARLYELCLSIGGPYDIYRYVNLTELLRLWDTLVLPRTITEIWERAIEQAGLAAALVGDGRRSRSGRLAG